MKISIATPSINQNRYLERSMRSVLGQEAGDLEYIVIDGGSTDGSLETIRKHADRLAYWTSRPNPGRIDALREAFAHSSGEIMGWIHPGETLAPWALRVVESIFRTLPQVEWITTLVPLETNEDGLVISACDTDGFNADAFYRGRNVPLCPGFFTSAIQRESTFWRRSLWERSGSRLEESLPAAVEFELWARFFQFAELHAVSVPLGCFRFQKKSSTDGETDACLEECRTVLRRYPHRFPSRIEVAMRRIARFLPFRMYPLTGLAYPAARIRQERRGSKWIVSRDWII